MDLSWYALT